MPKREKNKLLIEIKAWNSQWQKKAYAVCLEYLAQHLSQHFLSYFKEIVNCSSKYIKKKVLKNKSFDVVKT